MINSSLFVDMDMVLVDLDKGLRKLDPTYHIKDTAPLINPKLKQVILDTPNFWANLPKMSDFDDLWEVVSKLNPKILTANTIWDSRAKCQKWEWIQKNCEVPNYNFYCVLRDEKQLFAKTNGHSNILIDDYDLNCKEWEAKGGIAILHKSAKNTIKELKLLLNV
jgi:hypothetical protein